MILQSLSTCSDTIDALNSWDFDNIMGLIEQGVLIVDDNLHITYANEMSKRIFGMATVGSVIYAVNEYVNIIDENSGEKVDLTLESLSQPDVLESHIKNSYLLTFDRRKMPFDLLVKVHASLEKSPKTLFILVVTDLSQTKLLREAITFHQSHDALTGLVNRAEFERSLQYALKKHKEHHQSSALCYLDIDQFKVINDTCGHIAGDELLRQLTDVIQSELGRGDVLARIGGDEFGVLLCDVSTNEAMIKANQIRKLVESFLFSWSQHSFSLSASIGVVPINNKSENWASILSQADAACYHAKLSGRNAARLYSEDDKELAKSHLEMEWVSKIVKALRGNRLSLWAQPVVSLDNPSKHHQEILVRMVTDDGNTIGPAHFLPAAERFNLVIMIDRWVITNTFSWLRDNLRYQSGLDMCTINLSGCSLSQESFLQFVLEEFEAMQVPSERICFEITETAAVQHLTQAQRFITSLKKLGCSFALDDFGTGMSSFSYLKNLPVDYLKIDGAFVRDIASDTIDFAMVKSINDIGHAMQMRTIAEFVESEKALEAIREIGVDYAQGYYLGKPAPLF